MSTAFPDLPPHDRGVSRDECWCIECSKTRHDFAAPVWGWDEHNRREKVLRERGASMKLLREAMGLSVRDAVVRAPGDYRPIGALVRERRRAEDGVVLDNYAERIQDEAVWRDGR